MRRPEPLPTWDELVALAAEHDIHHVGVAPADVLERARTALVERKAAGLHAGMEFTYRNPDRSTDPSRAVEGARSVLVFAKPYLAEHEPERPPGVQGRVGRYAWVDHYGPLRTSLQEIARRIRRPAGNVRLDAPADQTAGDHLADPARAPRDEGGFAFQAEQRVGHGAAFRFSGFQTTCKGRETFMARAFRRCSKYTRLFKS